MRTEQLLRDTLADLADQARTPAVALPRILAGVPARAPRRRRTFVLVLAAVVLLALAVAVPTILVDRTSEPVGRVKGNWNLNHRIELPPGWVINRQYIGDDSESTSFGPPPGSDPAVASPDSCDITLWAPGRGDPTARSPERTPVTVNGRPGFWADDTDQAAIWGVSWEYQPGAYAQASCAGGLEAELTAAERVRIEPVTVHLPFRLRSVPRGWEGSALFVPATGPESSEFGAVSFTSGVDNEDRKSFSVFVKAGPTERPPGLPGWETDTVAGYPAVLSARDGTLCLNLPSNHSACLESSGGEPADLTKSLWPEGRRELLVDLAGRLRFARNLDDQRTWFPANRAIPASS